MISIRIYKDKPQEKLMDNFYRSELKKQIPDFYFVEAKIGEDPDKRDYIVSNEKIESTGFKPDYSLKQGIEELTKGYEIVNVNDFSNR